MLHEPGGNTGEKDILSSEAGGKLVRIRVNLGKIVDVPIG